MFISRIQITIFFTNDSSDFIFSRIDTAGSLTMMFKSPTVLALRQNISKVTIISS